MSTKYKLRICYIKIIRNICLLPALAPPKRFAKASVYCLLFLFSCGHDEKQTAIPANILPKEKMAIVITDIHIAGSEIALHTSPDSAVPEKLNFHRIFEKNKISKAQYDTSISFYVSHPDLLNEVYAEVMNELSKMQAGKPKVMENGQ